jgi:hypothetical protein
MSLLLALTAGGGPTYTLTALGGTYTYTGGSSNLLRGRTLTADGATYTYTGGAANLLRGRTLTADGGVYSYSGGAANLLRGRTLTAEGGTYAYTGGGANFVYTPVGAATYTLTAEGGMYAYTGGDALFGYAQAAQQATPGRRRPLWLPNQTRGETEEEAYARRVAQGIIVEVPRETLVVSQDAGAALYIAQLRSNIARNTQAINQYRAIVAGNRSKAARAEASRIRKEISALEAIGQAYEQEIVDTDVAFVAAVLLSLPD